MKPTISPRTLARLPMYYRYLEGLRRQGVDRISSDQLSRRMGITPSQLRQDLAAFGAFGHHGIGYHVPDLLQAVAQLMGLDHPHRLVVVGAGNLGRALASYPSFRQRGLQIVRLFDTDLNRVGFPVGDTPVDHIDNLAAYLAQTPIDIGVIATPPEAAQAVADTLVAGGVRAIWNFAPLRLHVPDDVLVEHTHISDSLFLLSLRLHLDQPTE